MAAALIEVRHARQIPGEPRRRWFASPELDLVVWCDARGRPLAFQLCYARGRGEHALTWNAETGFTHTAVDDGERDAGLRYKATPILRADAPPDVAALVPQFSAASARLPRPIAAFVLARLRWYPDGRG
jgi:hypothetical protein